MVRRKLSNRQENILPVPKAWEGGLHSRSEGLYLPPYCAAMGRWQPWKADGGVRATGG
ncbi:hypothetical protein [Parasphingorhabdus sp.]|uniref:hypothetical protein n=1 Tax=Parasphingorhabdus sp. TaxID=2709688 RepID=UPI003D2BA117